MDSAALESFVSTGRLPVAGQVAQYVNEAHQRFRAHSEGDVSRVYPALAAVPPQLFGICIAGTDGEIADVMMHCYQIPFCLNTTR